MFRNCDTASYLPRTERWQWTTTAQQRTNWDAILVKDTSHPIFTGMGEEIFIYQFPLDIDHLSTTDMGNGKVLATVMKSDGTEGTFAAGMAIQRILYRQQRTNAHLSAGLHGILPIS